jgi:hypothetical protein
VERAQYSKAMANAISLQVAKTIPEFPTIAGGSKNGTN